MPAQAGRTLTIKKNNVTIAKLQTKSITINKEPIDITSDDDSGWRTFIDAPASRSVDIECSAVTNDNTFMDLIMAAGGLLTDITITGWPSSKVMSGNFYLTNVGNETSHDGALSCTASLQSSGAIAWA